MPAQEDRALPGDAQSASPKGSPGETDRLSEMREPLVAIYTPGMGGMDWFSRRFVTALREAGLEVEAHDWTEYRNQLRNLRDRKLHERAAAGLVAKIAAIEHNGAARIVLIAHSTGCDIVLQALARLDGRVSQVILMAPAIAPNHDLRPALDRVDRMLVLSSPLDPAVSLGTTLFGTGDGAHLPAAGWLGFSGAPSDDPRWEHRRYHPLWAIAGHLGGHLGYLAPRFARDVLAPLLRDRPARGSGRVEKGNERRQSSTAASTRTGSSPSKSSVSA
jgi:pimeloyl-ACP methyl ester carboxylesterase